MHPDPAFARDEPAGLRTFAASAGFAHLLVAGPPAAAVRGMIAGQGDTLLAADIAAGDARRLGETRA